MLTGVSVGLVVCLTVNAIDCTVIVTDLLVFRPVIGMDKREIIAIANEIDTFETSILPYEDCCTVFTPKHPRTRPVLQDVIDGQNQFDFEPMIAEAVENTKFKLIRCGERTVNL